MLFKRIIRLMPLIVIPFALQAQETNSSVSGTVKTAQGEPLVGATVSATHNPTGTLYRVATRSGGQFNLYNLRPGGPYTISVSYVGHNEEKKEDIFLNLGDNAAQEFSLKESTTTLTEVTVATRRVITSGKGGAETNIGREKVTNMPSIGRNLNDFLRLTPQAKITGDGGVALAGQNNRYNAFFIDGANNSDIFGLAASGTNGGQAGISPISIDAIDQFQVILSPYDAQFGNFTGGGINATTKSGTNTITGSIYYLYRNQDLAGKSPVPIPKPGFPNVVERTKLAKFTNKVYGIRIGGPLIKNKLFYFISAEVQRDERPQPFDLNEYRGTAKQPNLDSLANYLRSTYGYEPGGYIDNPEKVVADRVIVKLDWNINQNNRLSISHRYNKGQRFNTSTSSTSTINFYNDGYIFPTRTNSTSLELKSSFAGGSNNRLLITATDVIDDRNPLGQPFPRVSIFDGPGTIVFGTENFSNANKLIATNISVFDAFKFYKGKQIITIGTDNEFNRAINTFIRDNFGTYTYNSLAEFYAGARPRRYQRSFSLLDNESGDNTIAAAKFRTMRVGFFVTDEIRVNDNFTLTLGVRTDRTELLTKPRVDIFFNDSAISRIAQYYDLKGAKSGLVMDPEWLVSPRIGFTYRMRDENVVVRGGMGIFAGRVPLVWPGGIYNNNGISVGGIDLNPPTFDLPFRPDPFGQYTAQELGINISNARGQIDLVAKDFKLPTVFRSSLAIDKRFGEGWTFTTEAIFTKNIYEIDYKNVNILPPIGKSNKPDERLVYNNAQRIPLRSNGTNPYPGNIFLLSNSSGRKGYSYNLSFIIDKVTRSGLSFSASYTYGNSIVLNEGTSSQNNSQWRFMETVNGRNNMTLSTSDFDLGHRVTAFVSKQFEYLNKSLATRITLFYNGQSGNPYSYVYRNSPVGDDGSGGTNDLIYIPTKADLASMIFMTNTVNGVTYTQQQQRDLLDAFILSDRYLRKNRGTFAERNGARLPFTHIVDLKLEQDFRIKVGGRMVEFALTYDVSNFTNMLNKDWGRTWFMSNDNFLLVQFVSFVSATNRTPQYRYTPFAGKPYGVSTSLFPGNNARWLSQVGLRLNF